MSIPPQPTRSAHHPVRDLTLLLLPILAIGGGILAYFYFTEYRAVGSVDFAKSIRTGVTNPEKLDSKYTDADGDLVADAPKDEAKQLDPSTLAFCTLEVDLKRAQAEWREFGVHLEKVTGKKVVLVEPPSNGPALVEALNAGKLHVASLSTGTVPRAVNEAGFVPCCVMADENGKYAYQMEILAHADGPIKSLAGFRGRTLRLTSVSSMSSFKAPVVMLWKEQRLRPDVDYKVQFSTGQRGAILSLAKGEVDAIAVANDYLARVVRDEKLDPKDFRTLYKSESYPPACFGYVSTLKPELAKKVKEAFLTFDWKGTSLEKAYRPANQVRFVEVNYKKDWEPVRIVDQAILELAGK